jgi:hypothetical protein
MKTKSKFVQSMVGLLFATFVVGCGGGDTIIDMGVLEYVVPSSVTVTDDTISGVSAKMLEADDGKAAGFVQWDDSTQAAAKYASPAQKFSAMKNSIDELAKTIKADGTWVGNLSLVAMQAFTTPFDFSIAQYKLTSVVAMSPMEVSSSIVKTLSNGTATGFPVADPNAPAETAHRLFLMYGQYKGVVFYVAFVIPESLFSQYEIVANQVTTGARVNEGGKTTTSKDETFTQQKAGGGSADFLFVVDDSGSMSDDQDALSQAAKDFTAEMSNSGVSYRSAIITTGDGIDDIAAGRANRILNQVGIIENNDTLLKEKLVAGTSGSCTETGILNAEHALYSKAKGDSTDGSVTKKGMPANNAAMSVIILSDEESQYTSRSGGTTFDTTNNLFTKRNIKVYGIINTNYAGQYDALAMATGGKYSSIENRDSNGNLDFSDIMRQIAQDAGGAASSFVLANPYVSITNVTVDGAVVTNNATNGWTANQPANSIVFHGTAIPVAGATIVVTYTYWP